MAEILEKRLTEDSTLFLDSFSTDVEILDHEDDHGITVRQDDTEIEITIEEKQ